DNEASATTATATSSFRAASLPFDAVSFSSAAAPVAGWSGAMAAAAASATRSASAGGAATATAAASATYPGSGSRSVSWNERAALGNSPGSGSVSPRRHESRRVERCALQGHARFDHDGGRRGTIAVDIADETKAALVQRANEALIVATVAERATRRADARAERRFRDDTALPDRVEQLVLGDDSIPVSHEMNEQIEHLRLDVDDCAGAPQLVPCPIDLEIGESEVQSSPLLD